MRQALGPGALGRPRGSGWRGMWEGGSGWGTHVNPWLFHFNVSQNSLQIKKLKKRKSMKKKIKIKACHFFSHATKWRTKWSYLLWLLRKTLLGPGPA